MAERNQAQVQGQGQGGPGDEEVLMELLRRLARGREEPKQEPQPRRMTRADRTQRINEQRRAANAWGMSPAKRKYLQEQAEKRYQRRAERKEEIRKRNLAKREARDAASAADREKALRRWESVWRRIGLEGRPLRKRRTSGGGLKAGRSESGSGRRRLPGGNAWRRLSLRGLRV